MKQLFLVTFALFVIVPSALFAFGSNEDIQLQFNIDLIQGYNFTPAINEIPQYYGEHAVADLNSHAGGSYFSQENTQANYSYGVSFEPRVFIYFIGVGCNFSFQWSAEAESKVGSNSYSDEVTYSSQFFAWSIIPTVYLRPYWSVND